MLQHLTSYLQAPVFPDDEDKTFTASLLHVILWALLVGICLYTVIATVFSFIQPHMWLVAWLYVLALGGLSVALMVLMRRGYVRAAAILIAVGLWIIMTAASYFNGGVVAPAYSGYMIVIISTCLLVSWRWGLAAAAAAALAGAVFLAAAENGWLPDWLPTYSIGSVWSANVTYFFAATMLLALALRAIKRAAQQTRHEMDERLKTEQALRHSEQRFRAIFDSVNDAILVQDLSDGRILDVNQRMCEMYGYTLDEARQLTIEDLSSGVAPYTQEDAIGWWQKAAGGEPQIFEWHAKDRAGRLFWVEVNMRQAAIDGQDRLLVVVRDIDDRRRTEAALRREQAYYEAIVNATPVMLWLKDTENRILRFNPAAARIDGLAAAEMEGKSAYDLYPRKQAEAYYRDDQEVLRSGLPKLGIIEQYAVAGSGKKIWVEMGKVPVRDDQGNVAGVLACAIDITERRLAEERERRASQGLRAVIEAAQELINCLDLDTLYRRSVELAREKLGLERCALYLLDDRAEFILGTFGTDDQGRTTDERGARHSVEEHPEVFHLSERIWLSYEKAYTYWKEDRDQPLGSAGWNVATPIRNRRRTVGVLYNDAGITHAPLDETQQDIVAVYCSLLGSLLELKHTEAELAREHDLLQALMDNFPDTIYFKDKASRFTRINRAQARLLGAATPEEAIGKTDAAYFGTDLAQLFLDEEQRLMSTGEPIIDRVEYNPTLEGRPRWLSASKVPLRDAAGQIVGMVGISRNITDRMLAEQRERMLSQGLRAVTEAAQELIGCADLDTLYQRAVELGREKIGLERCSLFLFENNDTLRGTYGTDDHGATTDERAVRMSTSDHPELYALPNQLWTLIESERTYWEGVQQHPLGAGWIVSTQLRSREQTLGLFYNDTAITRAPVNEAQQEVVAIYCSLLGSLIQLKLAEQARQESEQLYRRAIEAAGAVPYYLDYATESYQFVGEGIQQLTGIAPAEMQPSSWDTLMQEVHPLGEAAHLSWREAVRETRAGSIHVWRADYRVLTRDDRSCWINDASVQVLDEYGRRRGAIGILQDISDRKRVELALRESEATMRALLDAIPDAIFRFDASGVFKDFIPAKNFAPLVEPSEFIGKPFAAVMPPEITRQLTAHFQAVLDSGEMRRYEYALLIGTETRYYESRLVKMAQGDVLGMVRDVTDRKEAELALKQREAYLRSILDNFPYWIWLKDTAGRFLAVNKALASTYGYASSDELVGKTDDVLTRRELAEKYRADDRLVMESRQQKLVEEVVVEHGVERWFETFKSPVFDADGKVIGTSGFSHDVTARRQAEAAMRESEALFRYLADNAPAFISMTDETGQATYLNRAWQQFRGEVPALPIEEWAERVHPDDRRRYLHEFHAASQVQRKFTAEYRLRRVDGQYRWLLDTVVPRYTAGERFAGFIGIAIDITDRKNAEEALRRSESRLRLLADNMVDSIAQVDAHQRFVYVSPSVERGFGYSPRDLLGHPIFEIVHPEDSSRLYHQLLMAIELQAPSLRLEYRWRHADSHHLWTESEVRLLYDERGEFSGAVFSSRNVSERKAAEIERERLIVELEDKNAELERFTYTVSHDLKSPLITIRGFLGFLEKDALSGNHERLRADIGRIAEATTRMQRLLDELLDLSRVGRMVSLPEEISFEAVVREAVELVHGRIQAGGVQVDIAADLPVVYGDRTRLVEVVQNLVDNAVKFMGDQPEPRIAVGKQGIERSGMSIVFVRDNGCGIAPQYQERIFGLFNKLDSQTEGTGVGLALVKRIIDLHGGRIWVESGGLGQGSTFFFTLPQPPKERA